MNTRTARLVLSLLVLIPLAGATAWAPVSFPDAYAIVGARVEVGDGRSLEKATVLIRDGLIEAVGPDVAVPPDAEVIAGAGLVVYPGFVDAYAAKGLRLPEWQPNQDVAPSTSVDAPPFMREANRKGVRPELRAADHLALTEEVLAPYRQAGFTTALVAPSGGTINGQPALVNLSGMPKRESVVRPAMGMGFAFETASGGYPSSLMGIFAQLRQTLLDARHYRALQGAFENGSGRRPPADDTLAALQPVLDGSTPVLFEASTENQIRRALKLGEEFGLKLILGGGAEAWKVAPRLAQAQIPVLVRVDFGEEPTARSGRGGGRGFGARPPEEEDEEFHGAPATTPSRPEAVEDALPEPVVKDRRARWEERIANAARLHQAGVRFAFTTEGARDMAAFWADLRRAVQAGLPKEAALRALTLDAARIFGVERQLGTVEAGKIANLVVMAGEFTAAQARPRFVFIDQSKFEIEADRSPGRTGPAAGGATASGRPGAETAAETTPVELDEHRQPSLVTKGTCFIRGGTILTGTQGVIRDGGILVRDGKIAAIGRGLTPPPGVTVIDATGKFITPGIIDAHSHIAADTINEGSDNVTAEVRIHDVLNPQSIAIYRGLAGGVTAALVLHGSANVIGGQSAVIKMKWRRPVEELLVADAPRIIKFALGENPKRSNSTQTETIRFPRTRMGVEAVARRAFEEARRYRQAWDRYEKERASNPAAVPPRRDLRLEALADVLRGEIWVHCHAYRADEMLMLLRLAKEYGFKLAAFQHALEAYKIAPELAAQGVGMSTFSDMWAYKMEAFDAIPFNAALCLRAGIVSSINSDDAERMRRLNLDAAKSIRYGAVEPDEALKLVTLYPARQLGIAHRTGSLEMGKDADITIWDGHPLSVYSRCALTLIEGEVFFQRRDVYKLDGSAVLAQALTPCRADHLALPLPPAGRTVAIVGGTVHPVSGPDIANGTVLLVDGRIQAVGPKVAVPRDAVVVPARGLHVYPGLIDAGSQLGLTEIGSVRATADASENGEFQPDLFALTAVNAASEHFAVTRYTGITATLTRPTGGFIAGQSAVIHLAGWTPDEMRVKGPTALHVSLPEGGGGGPGGIGGDGRFQRPGGRPGGPGRPGAPAAPGAPPQPAPPAAPGAPPAAAARGEAGQAGDENPRLKVVREYFERAKRYAAVKAQAADRLPYDPRLEAMIPYVTGQRPVIFHTNSPRGVRTAISFAESQGLKPIIAGGGELWKAADFLAQKKVPVLYGPVYGLPSNEHDPYDTPHAAAALLHRAGVKLAFQSGGAAMARDLPYQAGIACAYGLPRDAALKALTLQAAEILGVSDALGSLEPGKLGNVIVTDGDPLEIATSVHYQFIAGKPVPLESKHTRLYQQYLQRLNGTKSNGNGTSAARAARAAR